MADEGNILTDLGSDSMSNGADNQPAIGLISQYTKDFSVENPNAPHSYQLQEQPQLDVQFNINATQIEEGVHEVALKVAATAKSGETTVYIIDLTYCGLIGIRNVPEPQAHAFLFAEAPRILFPFARRIVSDAVRDAGYPPLLLDPIDFNGLYAQQMEQRRQQEAASQGEGMTPPAGEA